MFSANHPLAKKKPAEISLKDFSDDAFFAPWSIVDSMIIDTISSYTRPYGFVPDVTFVKNHESMVTCVRNNMGVAIMDEWVWAKDAADLRWIPFDARDRVTVARFKANDSEYVLKMEDILENILS